MFRLEHCQYISVCLKCTYIAPNRLQWIRLQGKLLKPSFRCCSRIFAFPPEHLPYVFVRDKRTYVAVNFMKLSRIGAGIEQDRATGLWGYGINAVNLFPTFAH